MPVPAEASSDATKTARYRRNKVNCTFCRTRKVRCDAIHRLPHPCSLCERNGKECDAAVVLPIRSSNDRSELTAQVHRLNALLEDLEDGRSSRADDAEVDTRVVDLIGAMTALCFRDQADTTLQHNDLLQETVTWLADHEISKDLQKPMSSDHLEGEGLTRADIVSLLPHEEEASVLTASSETFELNTMHASTAEREVMERLSTKKGRAVIVLGPVVYTRLIDRMQSRAATIDKLTLSELAELLAFVCYCSVDRVYGHDSMQWLAPDMVHPRTAKLLLRVRAAKRALQLYECEQNPDLPSIRALWLLSLLETYCEPTTDHTARGVQLAVLGFSLAQQLGLNREDLVRQESAVERHNRRAIVCGLLQTLWHSCTWLTVLSHTSASHYDFPCPAWLSDSELPPAVRGRKRPDRGQYTVWRKRHEVLALIHQTSLRLSAPVGQLEIKDLGAIEKEVTKIEMGLPKEWLYTVAEDGKVQSSISADMAFEERVLAFYFSHTFQSLKLMLNRLFIMTSPDMRPESLVQRHRTELVNNARFQLQTWTMLAQLGRSCFASISQGFQCFITSALACALDIDTPGQTLLRTEVMNVIEGLEKHSIDGFLPGAVRKNIAILRFLLHRSTIMTHEAGLTSSKRSRRGQHAIFTPPTNVKVERLDLIDDFLIHKTSSVQSPVLESFTDPESCEVVSVPSESSLGGSKLDTSSDLRDFAFDFLVPRAGMTL